MQSFVRHSPHFPSFSTLVHQTSFFPPAPLSLHLHRRKRKNQSQAVQETYSRYPVNSANSNGSEFHGNAASMGAVGVGSSNASSVMSMQHDQHQYGQVNGWSQSAQSAAMEQRAIKYDTSFNTRHSLLQHMHNSYSQTGYGMSGPNQRMTAFPPNGSHNSGSSGSGQCTPMNGNMSTAMNGSMQCGPMSMHGHSANGMMQSASQSSHHSAEMNSMNLPGSALKNNTAAMSMSASMNSMYPSASAPSGRMRSNGYSPAAAGQQQQQQQQQQLQQQQQAFPVTSNKRAAMGTPPTAAQHPQQYPMGNVPFNNSANSMSNSYGPQNQSAHQFNSNQVSPLICLL